MKFLPMRYKKPLALVGALIVLGCAVFFVAVDLDALVTGSITYGGKYGPWRHALRASEPSSFWYHFLIYGVLALIFSAMSYQFIRDEIRH